MNGKGIARALLSEFDDRAGSSAASTVIRWFQERSNATGSGLRHLTPSKTTVNPPHEPSVRNQGSESESGFWELILNTDSDSIRFRGSKRAHSRSANSPHEPSVRNQGSESESGGLELILNTDSDSIRFRGSKRAPLGSENSPQEGDLKRELNAWRMEGKFEETAVGKPADPSLK